MDTETQINNDPNYQKFLTALDLEVEKSWKGNLKELYKEAGISKSYFSEIQNRRKKASFKMQVSIAEACGFTYEQFLNYSPSTPTAPHLPGSVCELDPFTREHEELVKGFVSKKIALELNRMLIELDKDDPIRFAALVTIVDKFVKGSDFEEIRAEKQEPKENPMNEGKVNTA